MQSDKKDAIILGAVVGLGIVAICTAAVLIDRSRSTSPPLYVPGHETTTPPSAPSIDVALQQEMESTPTDAYFPPTNIFGNQWHIEENPITTSRCIVIDTPTPNGKIILKMSDYSQYVGHKSTPIEYIRFTDGEYPLTPDLSFVDTRACRHSVLIF